MQYSTRTTRRINAEAGISLLKRRTWYAEEGQEQDATPAGNNGGSTGVGERKFTQSDIDEIVKERVKRAKETAAQAERQRILAELETDDLVAAKQALAEFRKGTGTAQALNERLTAIEKERDDALKQRDETVSLWRLDKRNGGLTRLAKDAKAINADDVILLAERLAPDALKAVLNDAGEFVEAEALKVIDAMKTARPEYFRTPTGSPSNTNGRVPGLPQGKTPQGDGKPKFTL